MNTDNKSASENNEKGALQITPALAIDLGLIDFTPREKEIILDNLVHTEEEPEDATLVASGLLPQLLAEALQEPPADDWERILDEL